MVNTKASPLWLLLPVLLLALFLAACSADGDMDHDDMESMGDMDHDDMENMDDMDHGDSDRVPNEGRTVRIVAPAAGAIFDRGADVVVEVETENFTLGTEENHWHVYVDGQSFGMVMGSNTDQVLRNLEPGTHEIEVRLSISTHEELEEGAAVTITVTE